MVTSMKYTAKPKVIFFSTICTIPALKNTKLKTVSPKIKYCRVVLLIFFCPANRNVRMILIIFIVLANLKKKKVVCPLISNPAFAIIYWIYIGKTVNQSINVKNSKVCAHRSSQT